MTKKAAWKKYIAIWSKGYELRSKGNALWSKGDALWFAAISPLTVKKWKSWNHCVLSNGSEWKA